ncbi:hypothetical protein J546_1617 [Acinetobacter sp. 1461402]|nr:hypothetical protein J546_1617 [Acinetobacter sp. 1461402]
MSRNLRIAKNIYLSVSKEKGFSFDPLGGRVKLEVRHKPPN